MATRSLCINEGGQEVYGIKVELVSETASFRDPNGQLFHATLPLPPASTIIGIAGAAMGLTFEKVWNWFQDNNIQVGAKGRVTGKGKDLWIYTKIKNNEITKDTVNREFLCLAPHRSNEDSGWISLYYACEKPDIMQKLLQSFQDPVYTLSLGTNDEMAKLKSIQWFDQLTECYTYDVQEVLLEGNWSKSIHLDWEKIKETPISISLSAPKIVNLPVNFEFDPKSGERQAIKYKTFTFIPKFLTVREPVKAFQYGDEKIPLTMIS